MSESRNESPAVESGAPRPMSGVRAASGDEMWAAISGIHTYIQVSPYFDPTYTRTGWIGQPPVLDRHEVVTDNGDVVTLRQATP